MLAAERRRRPSSGPGDSRAPSTARLRGSRAGTVRLRGSRARTARLRGSRTGRPAARSPRAIPRAARGRLRPRAHGDVLAGGGQSDHRHVRDGLVLPGADLVRLVPDAHVAGRAHRAVEAPPRGRCGSSAARAKRSRSSKLRQYCTTAGPLIQARPSSAPGVRAREARAPFAASRRRATRVPVAATDARMWSPRVPQYADRGDSSSAQAPTPERSLMRHSACPSCCERKSHAPERICFCTVG